MIMKKYYCTACDYVYDPEKGDPETGIAPGTPFEDTAWPHSSRCAQYGATSTRARCTAYTTASHFSTPKASTY